MGGVVLIMVRVGYYLCGVVLKEMLNFLCLTSINCQKPNITSLNTLDGMNNCVISI